MSNHPVPTDGAESIAPSPAPAPKRKLIWHNILFMTITPVLAAILTPIYLHNHGSSWGLWIFFAICYTISNMSITVGYHRYFSHRSYETNSWMQWLMVIVGSGAFQGSVLQWSTDHRRHHREVDGDGDPYSRPKGFWYSHLTWMFTTDPHPEAKNYAKDLQKNRWIVMQHNHYVWFASFMGFIVPGLVGWACGFGFWGGLIIGGLLRIVCSQHSTFLINSAAHTFGRQPYTDKHTARDSFIMSVLTFGEGYHNFHHSFQADYRNGTRWYHWDPTKWFIRALAFFGLTWKLKQAHKDEILKARLSMEERTMLEIGAPVERVTQLKAQIVEAQKKLKAHREEYRAAYQHKRQELAELFRAWRTLRRAEIRIAEIEFRSAYVQWRTFKRAVHRGRSGQAAA